MIFFIFALPILILIIFLLLKVKIKFSSFLKKGFLPRRDNFGLYCYCGAQGRGKTYSLVEYLYDNVSNIKVFSNIKDIHISGLDITYFNGFTEMLKYRDYIDNHIITTDKQLIFVYDELFEEMVRGSKVDKEVMDFLCQMRKRHIIFLTTCQYWSELPISFRKFCRYQIECKMFNLGFVGILWKKFRDGENMKWDESEQDFVAPLVENTITKCRKVISKSYNTNQRIRNA